MSAAPLPEWAAQRVTDLNHRTPELVGRVSIYETAKGGRKTPVPNGAGFVCMLGPDVNVGNDARLLFAQDWVSPGEKAEAKFHFLLGEEAAHQYREAGRFFLWEGRVVAEVEVRNP